MYNNDLFQNTTENVNTISGDNNYINNETDVNFNMNSDNNVQQSGGCMNGVQERVVHRTFVHDVPHTCPIHTRIINHHVYRHTYRPVYTCSEENTVSNVQCGSCSQFR